MKRAILVAAALALSGAMSAASAQCVTKGANATAGSADSAKWYVMETMVQQVSWGLWPGWVASGKLEGYKISNERYTCTPGGAGVFCRGRATFCKAG